MAGDAQAPADYNVTTRPEDLVDNTIEQVGVPDELRDKPAGRLRIDLLRCADLLNAAGVHYRNPVRHRHRLALIMRDENKRTAEGALQTTQFVL